MSAMVTEVHATLSIRKLRPRSLLLVAMKTVGGALRSTIGRPSLMSAMVTEVDVTLSIRKLRPRSLLAMKMVGDALRSTIG